MNVKVGKEWVPAGVRPADSFHVTGLDPIDGFLHGGPVMPHQFASGQVAEPDRGHRGMDPDYVNTDRQLRVANPGLQGVE